jgi:RNA recognition motif-containing protein
MGRKLYVGNLSFSVDSAGLERLFSEFGKVESASVVTDRESGRSRGFGFVEMSSNEEAEAAINSLNGQEHNGRALTVNEAKPREDRPRGGGGGGFGGGGGRGPGGPRGGRPGGGGGGGFGGGRGGRY